MRNKLSNLLQRDLVGVIFVCLGLLSPLFVAGFQNFGEQFFLDSTLINNTMKLFNELNYSEIVETGESISFVNTAFAFHAFGFAGLPVFWQGVVTLIIAFTFIFFGLKKFSFTSLGLLFLACGLLPLILFQGQLTKEMFIVVLIFLFSNMITSKTKMSILAFTIFSFLVIFYLRSYWVYTLALYIFFILVVEKFKTIHSLALAIVFTAFVSSLAYEVLFDGFLTDYRVKLNTGRDITDTASIIVNLTENSNIFTDFINLLFTFIRMFFPILFLNFEKIYIILYQLIWSVFNFLILVKFIKHFKNPILSITPFFLLLVSFIFTQAIFEGDLGSTLKHITGVLGLYLICLSKNRILKG